MSEEKTPKPKAKLPKLVFMLVPVAVIAALVLVFSLPPTHAILVNGPLKPVFARIGLLPAAKADKAGTPLDPVAEIKRLTDELAAAQKTETAKDARIAQLRSEVTAAQASASSEPPATPAPKPSPTAVSDEVKRAATYWAGMEPEKAADIVARLPNAYVKAVFAQMPADAVAEIMNAMPAKSAAKLMASADAVTPP